MMKMNKIKTDFNPKNYVHRLKADETGGFVASILEFPGCIAEGETAQEAIDNLNSAAESWIDAAISTGYSVREPIDFDSFSGKTALRMPRNLHKQAAELAELEGCSLNQLLVTAIAHYIGGKQLAATLQKSNPVYVQQSVTHTVIQLSTSTQSAMLSHATTITTGIGTRTNSLEFKTLPNSYQKLENRMEK